MTKFENILTNETKLVEIHGKSNFMEACVTSKLKKRGNEAKLLWPDALSVANQQQSLTGPYPFFNL